MRIVRVVATLVLIAAVAVGLPTRPARADGGDPRGYVWADQPTLADYVPASGYWFNSARRAVTVHRGGTGRYAVTFAGLGGTGGVAHAEAHGWGNDDFCTLVAWKPSGVDEVVYVACFGPGGVPADSVFVADYARRGTVAAAYFSSLYANEPTADAPYTPPAAYRSDSFGAPATVQRVGAGRYQVLDDTYPAALRSDPRGPQFAVTAVGATALHCWLWDEASESGDPAGYLVQCSDAGGRPVDAAFTLTFVVGGNLLGDRPAGGYAGGWGRLGVLPSGPAEVWDSSTGLVPTFERLAAGRYRAVFPGLGRWGGHVLAAGMGFTAAYCTVASWGPVGADLVVIVECYDIVTSAPSDVDLVAAAYSA